MPEFSKMTEEEWELWKRLIQLKLDVLGATFSFTDRLTRENRWMKEYTLRVIEEYRKFLFLCAVSKRPITPSDPIDQAWHLHLTYTKSYWNDLCEGILKKPLHHNPTQGGGQERNRLTEYYNYTFTQYRHYFQQEPPPDIWQDANTRFSEIHFVRANKERYWLVRKPSRFTIEILGSLTGTVFLLLILFFFPKPFFYLLMFAIVGRALWSLGSAAGEIESPLFPKRGKPDNDGKNGCSGGYSE
jgi:hypothetical protein